MKKIIKIETECKNCERKFKTRDPKITIYCSHSCSLAAIEIKEKEEADQALNDMGINYK